LRKLTGRRNDAIDAVLRKLIRSPKTSPDMRRRAEIFWHVYRYPELFCPRTLGGAGGSRDHEWQPPASNCMPSSSGDPLPLAIRSAWRRSQDPKVRQQHPRQKRKTRSDPMPLRVGVEDEHHRSSALA
jgi:hypothetical protein